MTSYLMNSEEGQEDANMVSGYPLTKMDAIALKEKSENFQFELKNALTGVINSSENNKRNDKEIQFLKELIVSHLDIIQQQAEQLCIKDRLINKLKNEKDTLVMRLVRMERRVNMDRCRLSTDSDKVIEDGNSTSSRLQSTSSRTVRRSSTDVNITDSSSSSSLIKTSNGSKLQSLSNLNLNNSHPRDIKKTKRNRRITEESVSESAEENISNGSSYRKCINHKLTSDSLYYTSVGEQECKWTPHTLTSSSSSTPQTKHSLLEVPSWRKRTYSSSYTMEGTENLQDDVFERRHANLYKDEKRRKRWDVQRIREMRHNERLRQRQVGFSNNNKSNACCDTTESLWPRPTRHTQLIVHQSVPVAAFGITLHQLQNKDFLFSSFTWPTVKNFKGFKKTKR